MIIFESVRTLCISNRAKGVEATTLASRVDGVLHAENTNQCITCITCVRRMQAYINITTYQALETDSLELGYFPPMRCQI